MRLFETIHPRQGLQLMDGETVLLEGAPSGSAYRSVLGGQGLLFTLCVVTIPLLPFLVWQVGRRLAWHRWWVTDRRLVVREGLIGWSVRSIPLDRIVDVTVRSSWWDQMFGVEHIQVRDMTGQASAGGLSTALVLLGVDDAVMVADRILQQTPSAPTSQAGALTDVVRLLERLVESAA